MPQKRLSILLGAVAILMLVGAVAYLRGRRTWVTITVCNESSERIRSARIRPFSLGSGMTDLGPIEPKQVVTIRLIASGYSGYSITPTFDSGRSFTTEEREALGGYAMTERIQDTESLVEWDSLSTMYERSFRWRHGWWLFPIFAHQTRTYGGEINGVSTVTASLPRARCAVRTHLSADLVAASFTNPRLNVLHRNTSTICP